MMYVVTLENEQNKNSDIFKINGDYPEEEQMMEEKGLTFKLGLRGGQNIAENDVKMTLPNDPGEQSSCCSIALVI
jgi:hypothetical protein